MPDEKSNPAIDLLLEQTRDLLKPEDPEVPERLCNCGTCQEALDTALRMYLQGREHECVTWMLLVGTLFAEIASADLAGINGAINRKAGIDPKTTLPQTMGELTYMRALATTMLKRDFKRVSDALVEVSRKRGEAML